jgi:hypothetical protein
MVAVNQISLPIDGGADGDLANLLWHRCVPLHMTTVVMECGMHEIQLKDVKASLSADVDKAMEGKPAVSTRHGKRQPWY